MLNWSEAWSVFSPCRLQLTRGFVVAQQPAGHPSQRPAEAGSCPAGLCINTTDAAGLPYASILTLMFRPTQQASNLSEMQFIAFYVPAASTGRTDSLSLPVAPVGQNVTIRLLVSHCITGVWLPCI